MTKISKTVIVVLTTIISVAIALSCSNDNQTKEEQNETVMKENLEKFSEEYVTAKLNIQNMFYKNKSNLRITSTPLDQKILKAKNESELILILQREGI